MEMKAKKLNKKNFKILIYFQTGLNDFFDDLEKITEPLIEENKQDYSENCLFEHKFDNNVKINHLDNKNNSEIHNCKNNKEIYENFDDSDDEQNEDWEELRNYKIIDIKAVYQIIGVI